jgi:2-oxo-4-hydroxy-4-carboxy-5-ureidoimidazoline decarboxylase
MTDAGVPAASPAETTATSRPPAIDDLDVIAPGAFAVAVAPLFEGARGFLGRLAVARPFGSIEAMFERAREIAHAMPLDEQLELIDAHPRLGAPPATVSKLSYVEQGYDRGTAASRSVADAGPERDADAGSEQDREQDRVAAELDRLNAAYEARFGFRYCVFVAARSRAELLPGMAAALSADREAEIGRALDAVVDIARARYATLTAARPEAPP